MTVLFFVTLFVQGVELEEVKIYGGSIMDLKDFGLLFKLQIKSGNYFA